MHRGFVVERRRSVYFEKYRTLAGHDEVGVRVVRHAERTVSCARSILDGFFFFERKFTRHDVLVCPMMQNISIQNPKMLWVQDVRRRRCIKLLSTKILYHSCSRFFTTHEFFDERATICVEYITYRIRKCRQRFHNNYPKRAAFC